MRTVMDILTAPFRGDALVVNLAFALVLGPLFLFVGLAGVFAFYSIPAIVILVPWFLRYCLVVGRQAAHGHRETPAFTLENVNPLEIPLIGLALGLAALYQALALTLGPAAAVIALGPGRAGGHRRARARATRAARPESRGAGALRGRPRPRLPRARGPARRWPVALRAGGRVGMGRVPGRGRRAVGAPRHLPRRRSAAARLRGPHRLRAARDTGRAPGQPRATGGRQGTRGHARRGLPARRGQPDGARPRDAAGPRARAGRRPGPVRHVLERLLDWRHPTVGPAFARHHVDRLHRLGRHGEALRVFLRVFDIEPVVRPIGEDATLHLARQAHEAKRDDVALALVADFEERFSQSRLLPVALLEHARRLFTERGEADTAAGILERLEREHPEVMQRDDVRRLRDRAHAATATAPR